MNGQSMWPKTSQPNLVPLEVLSQPGRKKKARNTKNDEHRRQAGGKLSKKITILSCGKCGNSGQNVRTFKGKSEASSSGTSRQKCKVGRSMQEQVAPTQANQSQTQSTPPQSSQSQEQNAPASTLHKYWKMYMDLNNKADRESDLPVAGKFATSTRQLNGKGHLTFTMKTSIETSLSSPILNYFVLTGSSIETNEAIEEFTEKKDYFELKFLAVYEAKTDGSVSTSVNKVLDPHNASCYQCRRICFSHFKSRNCGNYSLVSRIPLEKEIVAGERIEVYFEIAPSAFIVVKICQVQLLHRPPYKGGFSVDKIHGHKIGFDLVETSSGLANNDNDSKRSSIWEDEDLMINNKMESEYIYLFDDKLLKNFIIESLNTAQVLELVYGPYQMSQWIINISMGDTQTRKAMRRLIEGVKSLPLKILQILQKGEWNPQPPKREVRADAT
ncbi:hypothetical protein LguiB_013740 [Lonicera macranthoides]